MACKCAQTAENSGIIISAFEYINFDVDGGSYSFCIFGKKQSLSDRLRFRILKLYNYAFVILIFGVAKYEFMQ